MRGARASIWRSVHPVSAPLGGRSGVALSPVVLNQKGEPIILFCCMRNQTRAGYRIPLQLLVRCVVWPVLLILAACWDPKSTGPKGMVGRLVDSDGKPLAGVLVESLEAESTTDAEGRFAVQYKSPDQFVHFMFRETWYQLTYRPTDDGKVVLISLPPTRDMEARCELGVKGQIQLAWELGEGLSARRTASCSDGTMGVVLGGLPPGMPSARGAGQSVDVEEGGGSIHLFPPASMVKVELRAEDAALLRTCAVDVGGRAATRSDDGIFVGFGRGLTTVSAHCGALIAIPQGVRADASVSVSLEMVPTSPSLDLSSVFPGAASVWLTREGGDGYSLRLVTDLSGRWQMPPLTVGSYVVAVGDSVHALRAAEVVAPAAGTLYLRRLPDGLVIGAAVGRLWVERDMVNGAVPVRVVSAL